MVLKILLWCLPTLPFMLTILSTAKLSANCGGELQSLRRMCPSTGWESLSGLKGSTYQGSCLYPVLASPRCGRCGESALVSTKEPHAARFSLDKPPWAYLTYTDKNPRLVIYSLTVVSTYAHIDREKLGSSPGIGPGGKTFVHANQPNLTRRKVTRRTI